ncbi:hypothetical protein Smic_78810 [Streptomyces microflavus]|uniref:HTH cro/C1-type domain-containing protein n=1 Tax=Streptomyces microflavus TaxID=1919 RepID=A0A7J0D5Q8_STRMI|nr:hypothetical protein Smic_78810 [Streptomyces microflavus]
MLPRLPVGERVRDRRRRLGRTQAVLAGLCGITTDYLSQIERGLKTPSGDVLARLAVELQVPVGTLLGDTVPERAPTTASGSSRVVQALLQRRGACHPLPPMSYGPGWSTPGRSGRPHRAASPKQRHSCPT